MSAPRDARGIRNALFFAVVLFVACGGYLATRGRSDPAPLTAAVNGDARRTAVSESQLRIWCEVAVAESIAARAPGATWRWPDDQSVRLVHAGEAVITGSLHVVPRGARQATLPDGRAVRAAIRMQYVCGASAANGRASVLFVADTAMGGGRVVLDTAP